MKIVLTVVLAAIFLAAVWSGYRRGLILSAAQLAAIVVALYGAALLAGLFSDRLLPVAEPFAGGYFEGQLDVVATELPDNDAGLSGEDWVAAHPDTAQEYAEQCFAAAGVAGRPAQRMARAALAMRDEQGNISMLPGTLKGTKAIGWFIEEYGIAQVSMNITDINQTPLHVAFDEVCRCAQNRGLRVTGTEIVGLVPERTLIEAGKYFLRKQHRSVGIPKEDILNIAVKSMGLDDLKPFCPQEKVVEYLLDADKCGGQLTDLTVKGFADETARESPAPGGGSVSAYMGAMGAALGTMVANLSSHKPGWDDRWEEFSNWAEQGMAIEEELLHLVNEDTEAFNKIMAAFGMPKATEEDKRLRSEAIQQATLFAAQVPLQTMKASMKVFPLCKAMVETGNPNSVSDAGVGALAARAAVIGAGLNVKINASSLKDKAQAEALVNEANALVEQAKAEELAITDMVEKVIAQ